MNEEDIQVKIRDVESRLLQITLGGIKEGTISYDQSQEIAHFVLSKFYEIKTEEELIDFLKKISSQWSVFSELASLEILKTREENESKKQVEDVKEKLKQIQ